jgi:molecular chaperone GrpE
MEAKPSTANKQPTEATANEIIDFAVADSLEAPPEGVETDLRAELAVEKDRCLRIQAEMENLRARTAREIADHHRYAAVPLIRDLLPVVDNIQRAIEAAEKAGDAGSLLEGFKMVQQQLLTILKQHHCEPIPALGEPFDPQVHDAMLQQPSDEIPANHVALVAQVGYQVHDRVIRPAQVIISTGPAGKPRK